MIPEGHVSEGNSVVLAGSRRRKEIVGNGDDFDFTLNELGL